MSNAYNPEQGTGGPLEPSPYQQDRQRRRQQRQQPKQQHQRWRGGASRRGRGRQHSPSGAADHGSPGAAAAVVKSVTSALAASSGGRLAKAKAPDSYAVRPDLLSTKLDSAMWQQRQDHRMRENEVSLAVSTTSPSTIGFEASISESPLVETSAAVTPTAAAANKTGTALAKAFDTPVTSAYSLSSAGRMKGPARVFEASLAALRGNRVVGKSIGNMGNSSNEEHSSQTVAEMPKPATVGTCAPATRAVISRQSRGALGSGGSVAAAEGLDELPIMKYRNQILQHIRKYPVTCIQGETGCGKSTRVPYFLLQEDMELTKRNVKGWRGLRAYVTQPRRLACISLARRVAQELREPLGASVGYRVSGDSVACRETKICFVTTGYLLQVLINQPSALENLTHVILDEVHERDLDADLLSLVLKLQLRQRNSNLKLIVMSATLQGNLFAEYFTPAGFPVSPRIYVGAKRFPVQHIFLDDLQLPSPEKLAGKQLTVEELSGNGLLMEGRDEEETAAAAAAGGSEATEGRQQQSTGGMTEINIVKPLLERKGLMRLQFDRTSAAALRGAQRYFPGNGERPSSNGGAAVSRGKNLSEVQQQRRQQQNVECSTDQLQPQMYEGFDSVCLNLITCLASGGETVLIFLPGIAEITDLYETLSRLDSVNYRVNDIDSNVGSSASSSFHTTPTTTTNTTVAAGAAVRATGMISSQQAQQQQIPSSARSLVPSSPNNNDKLVVSGERSSATITDEPREGLAKPMNLKYRLFVLHSTISREEQEEVFLPPPPHTVHVVLASNIAESSLTLPAVRIVIDFCLKRQLVYDQRRHTAALVRAWTSHASSQQRSGRTGRVFPGLSIRLVSRSFYENCMRRFDPPEMQTAPLEKLYLTVKHLTRRLNSLSQWQHQHPSTKEKQEKTHSEQDTSVAVAEGPHKKTDNDLQEALESGKLTPSQLLRLTVQPPDIHALASARRMLGQLGALTSEEEDAEITLLGYAMMHLPIDTHLTKLLMLGIVMGCTCDALVLATVLACQDPFTMPSALLIKNPAELSERLQLSLKSRAAYDGNQYSEPIMLRNLFIHWLVAFASSVASVRARLARYSSMHRIRRSELNMKMEYLRVSQEFARVHSVVPRRMVNMAMMCVDLASRLRRILPPDSTASKNLFFFVDLLQNSTVHLPHNSSLPAAGEAPHSLAAAQPSEETGSDSNSSLKQADKAANLVSKGSGGLRKYLYSTAVTYSSEAAAAAVVERFERDMLVLKALLVASFAPTFLLGEPQTCVNNLAVDDLIENNGGNKKGKSQSRTCKWSMIDYAAAMIQQGLDPSRTLILHDRMPTNSSSACRSIRAALSLVCSKLEYEIIPCLKNAEKYFLHFPDTPINRSLDAYYSHYDAGNISSQINQKQHQDPLVLSQPQQESSNSNTGSNAGPQQPYFRWKGSGVKNSSSEEISFRSMGARLTHEQRLLQPEHVGNHVVVGAQSGLRTKWQQQQQQQLLQHPLRPEQCNRFSTSGLPAECGGSTYGYCGSRTLTLVAHMVNQFGNGRWRVSVMLPDLREEGESSFSQGAGEAITLVRSADVESWKKDEINRVSLSRSNNAGSMIATSAPTSAFSMVRPSSPFLVTWKLICHEDAEQNVLHRDHKAQRERQKQRRQNSAVDSSSPDSGDSADKEAETATRGGRDSILQRNAFNVKAVTNSRNPIGFYAQCPLVASDSSGKLRFEQDRVFAVPSMVQGTDDANICWVDGVTVLPSREGFLLILAFISQKHKVEFRVQINGNEEEAAVIKEVRLFGVKQTLPVPLDQGGATITFADLCRASILRNLLSQVFSLPLQKASIQSDFAVPGFCGSTQTSAMQNPVCDSSGALLRQGTISITAVSSDMDTSLRRGGRYAESRASAAATAAAKRAEGATKGNVVREEIERIDIDENAAVRAALVDMLTSCNAGAESHTQDGVSTWPNADLSRLRLDPACRVFLSQKDISKKVESHFGSIWLPAFKDISDSFLAPFDLTSAGMEVQKVAALVQMLVPKPKLRRALPAPKLKMPASKKGKSKKQQVQPAAARQMQTQMYGVAANNRGYRQPVLQGATKMNRYEKRGKAGRQLATDVSGGRSEQFRKGNGRQGGRMSISQGQTRRKEERTVFMNGRDMHACPGGGFDPSLFAHGQVEFKGDLNRDARLQVNPWENADMSGILSRLSRRVSEGTHQQFPNYPQVEAHETPQYSQQRDFLRQRLYRNTESGVLQSLYGAPQTLHQNALHHPNAGNTSLPLPRAYPLPACLPMQQNNLPNASDISYQYHTSSAPGKYRESLFLAPFDVQNDFSQPLISSRVDNFVPPHVVAPPVYSGPANFVGTTPYLTLEKIQRAGWNQCGR